MHASAYTMRVRKCIWTFIKIAVMMMAFYQLSILFLQGLTEGRGEENKESSIAAKEQPPDQVKHSFLSVQLKALGHKPFEKDTPNASALILPKPPVDEADIQEKDYFKLSPNKVNPFVFNYVSSEYPAGCEPDSFMVVLIHSRPDYIEKRNAIRKTWGDAIKASYWPGKDNEKIKLDLKMRLAFVLGQIGPSLRYTQDKITQEAEQYKDIIQGDFIDAYKNMTLKSVLGLKWVVDKCPDVKFLLKSDDDMFIYLPGVVQRLQNLTTNRTILGPYNGGSKVYRKGKWGLSLNEYPFPFYPPYESGSTYIFTGDLVKPLFEASEYVKPIFVDDVYITGILGQILNVTHEKQGGFSWEISKKPTLCSFLKESLLSGTKVKPDYMLNLWDAFQGHGSLYTEC